MRFRQCTMHNSQLAIERLFCRGELRSPVIDSVILSRVKNFEDLVEVGGRCE